MEAAILPGETESVRSAEGFWPHGVVNPRAADYDAGRLKFGWKELSIIGGAMLMVLAAIWSVRGQIDTLGAKFDGYRDLQNERFANLQREFDELKREERMNKVLMDEEAKRLSGIEGILTQMQRSR